MRDCSRGLLVGRPCCQAVQRCPALRRWKRDHSQSGTLEGNRYSIIGLEESNVRFAHLASLAGVPNAPNASISESVNTSAPTTTASALPPKRSEAKTSTCWNVNFVVPCLKGMAFAFERDRRDDLGIHWERGLSRRLAAVTRSDSCLIST
jgi:hypothetical protein